MYEKEVAAGGAWLDQNNPGWWKTLDLNKLNQSTFDECTLGLTLGRAISQKLCVDYDFAQPRGFVISHVGLSKKAGDDKYALLTATWIREIMRRRAAEALEKDISSGRLRSPEDLEAASRKPQ